jgi:6-phosphogluconolactonase
MIPIRAGLHRPISVAPCKFILIGLVSVLSASSGRADEQQARRDENVSAKMLVYVGTYTGGKSQGIYACELDPASGALRRLGVAGDVKNPSFLAIHPNRQYLYAVSEVADLPGGGAVTAFAIDLAGGRLTRLNHQSSRGAGPCHLVVDRQGNNVLVANYSGGSVAVLPIEPDGRLAPASAFIKHQGSSINPQRQEGPHAHSINVDPANRFAVAADLGLDKVMIYRFDSATGRLAANDPPSVSVPPGSGPRHFAFHPDGLHAYVINELKSTVTAFNYDYQRGRLEVIQTISTLPKDYAGENTTAEVQVHPSGKFLYGSNRGHDSIALFEVDRKTGRLAPLGHQPTAGHTPRNFGIDPDGRYLLAANQDSDSVQVFRIDEQTGRLSKTDHQVEIPAPVCVKFVKRSP